MLFAILVAPAKANVPSENITKLFPSVKVEPRVKYLPEVMRPVSSILTIIASWSPDAVYDDEEDDRSTKIC